MIKIGMSLTLEPNQDNDEEPETFRCKLVEQDDQMLYIDYPVNEKTGRTGFFFEGTQFKVTFVGEDQSIYMFNTEVKERKKLQIPVLAIHNPGKKKMIRIQRRQYVRVETAVDVSVQGLPGRQEPFTTITLDISGGGAAVIPPEYHQLQEQDHLEVWFVIPLTSGETHYIKAISRIVRIFQEKATNRDQLSLEFMQIDNRDREVLIRFCFERQLLWRRSRVR
ncbi:flagellar brake domain-containing protein [Pontibacillus sp. ALD_SL1]|uniref:flagellar brake protein n=1 Tax=Pontibacillus sp. ALD_SL1 TaxID=2777185 RepID=UPI001A95BA51|nr:flagellar brake domain-containing protein [Pontibacillus sp. ALD_SL1]QSS98486.1 flagellar brake domain-containing protein [Pontibacillus sp. ALD_SL1]